MTRHYVLTLSCPDRPGIVHAVAGFLVAHGGNILASQQFGDPDTARFFMRVEFETLEGDLSPDRLGHDFGEVAEQFTMTWALHPGRARTRVLVLVSKLGHCLNDLLFRWHARLLPIEIVAVVSNHPDCKPLVGPYDVPFHHIPVTPATRSDAEQQLRRVAADQDAELLVLARYMQVLSEELCHDFEGRIINIHHSFLPSFRGARPYHQAYARGVKLIGATAHYVTPELDEGPIIDQDVERVDHSLSPEQLAGVGHDIECQVLARAVRWHAEHRVLLNGNRTVVFR
ncbi:MAG TPA: formyltetrahydrofolate deformylase [Acidimicrobiales bacterium]|jgi:formyltetrahydrofolate deformylase|nr:formyltetrahydrofolate deformylase [Acidimicrobiales bacterium]